MSLDLDRTVGGIDLISDDFSSSAYLLQESGLPGGDGDFQDAAPIGSVYMRTDVEANNLQFYYKWTNVNNNSDDWKVVTSQDYVDNLFQSIVSGISWREPVRVRDGNLYANAAAFPITGTIDGVVLSDQDRVLFSNVTTSTDENVFIWTSGTTSWSEDANVETDGDAVLVQEGTSADEQWVYDGVNWVQFGSGAAAAELGYIRTFMGKTGAGSELPTYSSTNLIIQSSNLETAIGDLDSGLGTGEITNDGSNYVLSDDLVWGAAGTLDITEAFNEINEAIGNRTYTEQNVVTNGETLVSSIDALDVAIGDILNDVGVIDHGNLLGLGDDDHPQYYNQTRGDARYSLLSHVHDADEITYDNTTSGLVATDVQDAIDELAAAVPPVGLFGSEFQFAEDLIVTTTTQVALLEKLKLTTPALPAGTYRIGWSFQWNHNSTSTDFLGRVQLDDTDDLAYYQAEPSDSSYTGTPFSTTGTDQQMEMEGFSHKTLGAGVHTIDIDFATSVAGDESSIWNVRLEIWRVA